MDDRRVHVVSGVREIVRYDRAGKWYAEITTNSVRTRIDVREAARLAKAWEQLDPCTEIRLGVPGGSTFDRLVSQ